MTFEEETRQMFSNLIERLNRLDATVAHMKPVERIDPQGGRVNCTPVDGPVVRSNSISAADIKAGNPAMAAIENAIALLEAAERSFGSSTATYMGIVADLKAASRGFVRGK